MPCFCRAGKVFFSAAKVYMCKSSPSYVFINDQLIINDKKYIKIIKIIEF